jgi:methionyl-tRNA formyltransferase
VRVLRSWWAESIHQDSGRPGQLALDQGRLWVCCGDGRWLELREIQFDGEQPLADAALTARFAPDDGGMGQFSP